MAGGRGFSRTAAALLLLGTAWAGYATATGWHGTDGGGSQPEAEGYSLAGETEPDWLPVGDRAVEYRVTVWLREGEIGDRTVDYWMVSGLGDCRGTLDLPKHDMWRGADHVAGCGFAGPDDTYRSGAALVAVPPGTETGVAELGDAPDRPLTVVDTPEHWPVGIAVVVSGEGGAPHVDTVRVQPSAFTDGLFALPPLPPSDVDASEALRALGPSRGIPLGYARVGEDLLVFYLDEYSCGVLAATADGVEMLDVQVPPPFAGLPRQRQDPGWERDPDGRPEPPGGPYSQAVRAAASHEVSLDVRCGLRAMVVAYQPREHLLLRHGGPVDVLGIGQDDIVFAVGGEPVRTALLDHAADEDR